ncbi:hypothetical protein C0J52_11412 [Blattella germanica]|nr:hypothetical protein C0J52_11412 [Blattella germanica]
MSLVPERFPSNNQVMMSLQTSKYSSIQVTCKENKNISSNGHLLQLCHACSESSNY